MLTFERCTNENGWEMSNIRNTGYWMLDRLRGGPVAKHLVESSSMIEDPGYAQEHLPEIKHALFEHVTENVPYYRDFKDASSLDELPVINKAILRKEPNRMVADGFDLTRMHIASTSGSTGVPLNVYQDPRRRLRVQADVVYWANRAGYQIGTRLYDLKVLARHNKISRLARIARNAVPVDVVSTRDDDLLRIVDSIAAERVPVSVLSFSSTLELIARALKRSSPPALRRSLPRITAIIGQSESLSSQARTDLAYFFGSTPFNRYALEELGIVAQQAPGSGESFVINRGTHFVEVLDFDSDIPAKPGVLGRIVVTDLVNRVQPMVRYDTGDSGKFALYEDGSIDNAMLAEVGGRRDDEIFDINDQPLTNAIMEKIWWRYPEVNQQQVIQVGKSEYVLRLNVPDGFVRSEEFADDFRGVVGASAQVRVETTDEDFVFPSGKRKSVVNQYIPAG